MANYYTADDGTIHDRDIEENNFNECNLDDLLNDDFYSGRGQASHYVGLRKFFFWVITLPLAAATCYLLYNAIGVHIFEISVSILKYFAELVGGNNSSIKFKAAI